MENFIKIEIERISGEKILKVFCKKSFIYNIYFENGNFGVLNFIDKTVNDVFVYENEEEFIKGSKEIKIFRNKNDIKNQKDFISFNDNIIKKDCILAFKTNIINQKDKCVYTVSNIIWLVNENENFIFSVDIYYELDKDTKEFNLDDKKIINYLKNNSNEYKIFLKNVSDLLNLVEEYKFIKFGSIYINKNEISNIELDYVKKNFFLNEISFGIRIFLKNTSECFKYFNTLNVKDIKVNEFSRNGEISIIELITFFYKKLFKKYSTLELEEILKFKEPKEYKKHIELKNYLKNLS